MEPEGVIATKAQMQAAFDHALAPYAADLVVAFADTSWENRGDTLAAAFEAQRAVEQAANIARLEGDQE